MPHRWHKGDILALMAVVGAVGFLVYLLIPG